MARDHPRSRGVYYQQPSANEVMIRIIPARAGFTRAGCAGVQLFADHPRSRGVYSGGCGGFGRSLGSSPLARGLLPGDEARAGGRGIIPARAGFTRHTGRAPPMRRDHPRSRGVYFSLPPMLARKQGSSPLARGLPAMLDVIGDPERIIPARAGFTRIGELIIIDTRDHPRSRGVYCPLPRRGQGVLGSSPLARGLRRKQSS